MPQQTRKRVRFDNALKTYLDGASRTSGYRYIKNGILPAPHKIGRFSYFFEDELLDALDRAANPRCGHGGDTVGAQYTTRDEDDTDKKRDEKNTGYFPSECAHDPNTAPLPSAGIAEKGERVAMPLPVTIAAAKRMGGI